MVFLLLAICIGVVNSTEVESVVDREGTIVGTEVVQTKLKRFELLLPAWRVKAVGHMASSTIKFCSMGKHFASESLLVFYLSASYLISLGCLLYFFEFLIYIILNVKSSN